MPTKLLKFLGMGSLILFVPLIVPCAAIWAFNTLFDLHIALTLKTWFAALVLCVIAGGQYGHNAN